MSDFDELKKAVAVLGKFDGYTHEQIFKFVEDGGHADPAFVLLEIMIHRDLMRAVAQNRESLQLMLKIHVTLTEILDDLRKRT